MRRRNLPPGTIITHPDFYEPNDPTDRSKGYKLIKGGYIKVTKGTLIALIATHKKGYD